MEAKTRTGTKPLTRTPSSPSKSAVRRRPITFHAIEPQGGGIVTWIADLLMVAACFAITTSLTERSGGGLFTGGHKVELLVLLGAWTLCGTWRKSHRKLRKEGAFQTLLTIAWNFVLATCLTTTLMVVIPTEEPSEGTFLVALLCVGVVGLSFIRFVEIRIAGWMSRAISQHKHRILFVGNNTRTREILESIRRSPQDRVQVVGLLDPDIDNPAHAVSAAEVPYSGSIDKLTSFLYGGMVDEVVVTLPVRSHYEEADRVLHACSDAGIRAQVLSDIFNLDESRSEVSDLGGTHAMAYARGPVPSWRLAIKRHIDCVGSAIGIVLLSPLIAAIAIAIKLTSPGPILFRQTRSGLNGRVFEVLKFRTMCIDAESRKTELLDDNEVTGPVFKMKSDPRITRIGKLLRKYSLDELPQLFNVLKGDMSLVGPRPPIPSEVKNYNFWQLRRLSMRPGLTCFWQVSGRNNIDFEEWMRLDLRYIDNWSLTLDVLIMLKTIPTVLRGTGM